MDFDSLPRRDLQFFCKRNKIPANITNIAMADALKSLEIVEGIDEFVNRSESTCDLSPTSVAKAWPSAARTAARTTRRKTKDETQSSELVTRSCHVTCKSLAGEMDQENINTNVPRRRGRALAAVNMAAIDMKLESNVSKTPVVRSTRRAKAAASDESVQRVYSTRRSVKLLEESMADLSLKTKESIHVPVKKNDDSERENSPAVSKSKAKSDDNFEKTEEAEVRDINDSLEMEWDGSKSDPDLDILYGDLGDITFFDAKISEKQMTVIESNTVLASDSFVLVKEQETLKEDDFLVVDYAASPTTNFVVCNKESQSEQMKNDSESEPEETEYQTDPSNDDDSGVFVDTNQETFASEISASGNVSKVDSVTTVLFAEESKPEEDKICESGELTDNETEVALVSDKKNTQAFSSFSPTLAEKEAESDSDGWSSDFEINSFASEELIHSEAEEEAPVSEKKAPSAASSSSSLASKERKTPLKSPFKSEEAPVSENVEVEEMVLNNNGERKYEAEANMKTKKKKKKTINEESFKDVSMRQLTKMVRELAIKSKQQRSCLE